MNFFQAANGAASFLVLGAIGFGTANAIKDSEEMILDLVINAPSTFFLILFLVMFKIKTALDDHKHFGDRYQFATTWRFSGFILAMFSWLFFALSGYFVGNPLRSAELLGVAIILSSLWIVIHLMEILFARGRPTSEDVISEIRQKWVLINLLYLLCIVVFLGWIEPVIEAGDWRVLSVIIIIFLFDIFTSRSFRGMAKKE